MNVQNRQKLRVGDIVNVVKNDPLKSFLEFEPDEEMEFQQEW